MSRFISLVMVVLGMLWPWSTARAETPSTRPASGVIVGVMPFNLMGEAGHEWVPSAIQDGVTNGVQKQGVTMITLSGNNPIDAPNAMVAGRSAGADYVVFGSVQIVDEQIRVSAKILSVEDARVIDKISSDGAVKDLFNIENILIHRVEMAAEKPAEKPVTARPQIQLLGPVAVYQPKYFDRDFSSSIAVPDQWRSKYDSYYYHSSADGCWGYGYCGYGCFYGFGRWGCWGFPGWGGGGGFNASPAAHWSGW